VEATLKVGGEKGEKLRSSSQNPYYPIPIRTLLRVARFRASGNDGHKVRKVHGNSDISAKTGIKEPTPFCLGMEYYTLVVWI